MIPASPTLIDPAQLVGIREIADYYEVTDSAVCQWRTRFRSTFPPPVRQMKAGPLFLMPEVTAWHTAWRTRGSTP